MNSPRSLLAIVVVLLCILAPLSYLTTATDWDGGFPFAEIRMTVQDPHGQALKGAVLHIYHGGTRTMAFGYPLANHVADADLVSDESGKIVAVQERMGMQFGGHAWALFWFIPMGQQAPRFDCEIMAPGYQPATFDIWQLFDSPHKRYAEFPKTKRTINDKESELPVYEQTFTLSPKKPG